MTIWDAGTLTISFLLLSVTVTFDLLLSPFIRTNDSYLILCKCKFSLPEKSTFLVGQNLKACLFILKKDVPIWVSLKLLIVKISEQLFFSTLKMKDNFIREG